MDDDDIQKPFGTADSNPNTEEDANCTKDDFRRRTSSDLEVIANENTCQVDAEEDKFSQGPALPGHRFKWVLGIGRAGEHKTFWRATYLGMVRIDADRAPPSRRRPVHVRRRRSQRRAERGERSEGGKCHGLFGIESRVQRAWRVGGEGGCHQDSIPNGACFIAHHPERNSGRSTRKEMSAWSARCSLGAERGGWGCRRGVRNWEGVTPTWRDHRAPARAHLQKGSHVVKMWLRHVATSQPGRGSPAVLAVRHLCSV